MSIYKEIKSTGIDLFVSYHPKVLQLKKESKVLHKELKSKGLSLMQCQELTAKQNGFNNWYNFIHLIKRHYQQDLDNLPFILTTTKNSPTKDDYKPKGKGIFNNDKWLSQGQEDHPILLGYDINFGHYKWQNDSSMKTHQMILGESIYKRYDVYLANQAMKKNRNIIFFDGEGDYDTLESLVKNAKENRREADIKIINFWSASHYPEYEHKIQNNFLGSSGLLTESFFNLLKIDEDFWKSKCINFLSGVMMYLVYQRDKFGQKLTLETIKNILNLDNVIEAVNQEDLPLHINSTLVNYLNSLPNYDKQLSVQPENIIIHHKFITSHIEVVIDSLINSKMFNDNKNSIQLHHLLDKSKSNIYILQFCPHKNETHEIFNKLFLNSIKGSMATMLGASLEITNEEIIHARSNNRNVLYVFIRSCYTPRGIAVLPSQARSLGLSINFSYSNLDMLEDFGDAREAEVLLANTNTKIFSGTENEPKTVALLEKYKNEVSDESVLNINEDNLSININYNKRKNDYVWLVKKGYASQVSFDSPYEPISDISSRNISIHPRHPQF